MAQKDIAAQILELAIDLRESIPKGSESASAWMTKAREFVDTCIINGHLSNELLTIISIKERGGFIGLLKNIQHASGSYNTGLSTSIDNNLATIIKVLKDVAKLESRHNFSVASLSELRNNLTSVQKRLFDEIWNLYVSSGSGFLLRNLPSIVEKQPMKDIFKGLNGSLINDKKEQNDTVFKLTVYGALLTVQGPSLASLLVRLLDFVKERYESNSSTTELNKEQIKIGLDLSDNETQILFRLLTLYLPPGMPISISNYQPEGRDWQIRIPDVELIHFINFEGTLAFLDDRLSAGYRPEQPFPSDQGLMTQQVQGVSFSNLNTDISVGVTGVEARAPYGSGGYSVLSGPGVVGYGTGGQPTASSSTNESALSILSSTHTEIEAESDLLGRKKLTTALYRLLTEREDDYAFAIGLFGHWGTGKSSQIKFIESELNKTDVPRIMVAHFNAWQSESSSNLGAMLAQAVVDRLLLDKGFWEKIRLAIQLTLLRQSKTWGTVKGGWRSVHIALSKIGIFLPQLLLLLAIGLIIRWFLVSDLFSSTQSWVATTIATIVAPTVFFASAYHFMRSHLTEWFKHLDLKKSLSIFALPDYSSHRGAVLDIHRTLEDLCSLCLKNNKPEVDSYLLLVVDDLDRCKVDTVKEVLDAVRLVANIKHVVTMVAIDERMAFAAVEKHYDQFGHAGRSPDMVARDYLAKVLQVSITLPEITDDGIASYIDQKIFGDITTDEQSPLASPSEDERAHVRRNTMIENDRNNIDQMQLAPDSMQEPSSNEPTSTPLKPRQSPFPKEKELFKVLAQTYNFSNPRLLWRHYMAWKLLKSLCLGDTYVEEDIRIPMQLLFWKEWLNQQTVEDRKLYSEWMDKAEGQGNPDEKHGEIYPNVKLNLRPHWRQMPEGLSSAVDAVVLPASPQDIASTKGHVVK